MLGDLLASAHSADCPEFLTACGRAMLLNKFADNLSRQTVLVMGAP